MGGEQKTGYDECCAHNMEIRDFLSVDKSDEHTK